MTPGRDIRVLYLDGYPAGFFDISPELPEIGSNSPISA